MGKLKNQAITKTPVTASHKLTEDEFALLKYMEVERRAVFDATGRTMSGFMHYVAERRFGVAANENVQFEVDLDGDDRTLKITTL